MTRVDDVTYKGHTLTATALSDHDMFRGVHIVSAPSGGQQRSSIFGKFPSAICAVGYAFAYGMTFIDYRQAPTSVWLHSSNSQTDRRLAAW
jgi:hypothetical protein